MTSGFDDLPNKKDKIETDIVIVGGGVAGTLAGLLLSEVRPSAQVLLVEKEDHLGGRLTGGRPQAGVGLGFLDSALFNLINQVLCRNPENSDLLSFFPDKVQAPQGTLGYLTKGEVVTMSLGSFLDPKSLKILAGGSLPTDWDEFWQKVTQSPKIKLNKIWKAKERDPLSILITRISDLVGIFDPKEVTCDVFCHRVEDWTRLDYPGPWGEVFKELVRHRKQNLKIATQTEVVASEKVKTSSGQDLWSLTTSQGTLLAPNLVVAQPPWQALSWLRQDLWSETMLKDTFRSQPGTCVAINVKVESPEHDFPDRVIIPAERTLVRICQNEVSLRTTLDFETSMKAKEVATAVSRLRRALEKLTQKTGLTPSQEHLSLVSYGFTQSQNPGTFRLDLIPQDLRLFFIGDSFQVSEKDEILTHGESLAASLKSTLHALTLTSQGSF